MSLLRCNLFSANSAVSVQSLADDLLHPESKCFENVTSSLSSSVRSSPRLPVPFPLNSSLLALSSTSAARLCCVCECISQKKSELTAL